MRICTYRSVAGPVKRTSALFLGVFLVSCVETPEPPPQEVHPQPADTQKTGTEVSLRGRDAGKADEQTQGPIIARDTKCDLGLVEPGSAHRIAFPLSNPHETALELLHAKPDCPCVEIIEMPSKVDSKEEGTLVIEFVAPQRASHYHTRIGVTTAGSDTDLALFLSARVGQPLWTDPTMVSFSGLGETRYVVVHNDGSQTAKILYALSEVEGAVARIPAGEISPGGEVRVPFVANSARSKSSRNQGWIHLHTNLREQPILAVAVVVP